MEYVLITGGIGFVGSYIVVELVQQKYNVVIIDNCINSNIDKLKQINELCKQVIHFYPVDMCNMEQLNFIFKKFNIVKVIHLASLKKVGESVIHPLMYYENNIVSTLNLLKLMNLYKVNDLIFSSSAAVYKEKDTLLEEDDALCPSNPYGNTKWMIEIILKDYHAANPDFNCVILRYFNPVGNHPGGLLKEVDGDNIMPVIARAMKEDKEVEIYGNDYDTVDGTGVRDYIHVMDLAAGHIAVMNCKGFNIYNLGTGKGTSVLQLIQRMDKNIKYKFVSRRNGDVAMSVCNTDKIKKELGWEAKRALF